MFSLHLACLVFDVLDHVHWKLLASNLLSLVAATAICVLSFLEHGRNVEPSTLLTSYLVATIFSDVIQAGLLYVAQNLCNPWGLASATFAAKLVLLALEGQTKRHILREPYDKLSPEETVGYFGVVFFWWVNRILKMGYSKVLSLEDMPPLGRSLDVMKTREVMQREWDRRRENSCPSLPWHLDPLTKRRQARRPFLTDSGAIAVSMAAAHLHCPAPFRLRRPTMLPAASHQSSHCFRQQGPVPLCEQERSLSSCLVYLYHLHRHGGTQIPVGSSGDKNITDSAFQLSSGIYERLFARLSCLTRMALVGIIHNRCLTIKDGVFDEAVALTLMSDDTEDVASSGDLFHELWSQVLELSIGIYMLARELGWVCIFPLFVVFCGSLPGLPSSRHAGCLNTMLTPTSRLPGSQGHHRESRRPAEGV